MIGEIIMFQFGFLYVVFKKCISLVTLIALLLAGAGNEETAKPDGAQYISKHTYVLNERYMVNQGITTDGEYFYFSGKKNLAKAKVDSQEICRISTNAIPKVLEEKGCDHIGGISYYNGIIYAAIEDGPDYNNSFIALYDAETLKFTGVYKEVPHDLHLEGIPWCAVDAERNRIYTAEWSNAEVLNVFDLETLELIKTVELSDKIDRIQGAEMFGGKLYLSCDEENDLKRVFVMDVETGVVEPAFSRNVGKEIEAEDLTIYADENGEPIFCVIDRSADRDSVILKLYKMNK